MVLPAPPAMRLLFLLPKKVTNAVGNTGVANLTKEESNVMRAQETHDTKHVRHVPILAATHEGSMTAIIGHAAHPRIRVKRT